MWRRIREREKGRESSKSAKPRRGLTYESHINQMKQREKGRKGEREGILKENTKPRKRSYLRVELRDEVMKQGEGKESWKSTKD